MNLACQGINQEGFVLATAASYDEHTLKEVTNKVIALFGTVMKNAFVDKGYKGHG